MNLLGRIRSWWRNLSLRGKLTASIIAPSLIVVSVMYYYSTRDVLANFDREYRERAMVIAQTLQHVIRTEDLVHTESLQRTLEQMVRTNGSLERLSVYGTAGTGAGVVLASSDPSLIGKEASQHDLEPLTTGKAELEEERDGDFAVMEANVPLILEGATVATIGVYVSLDAQDDLIQSQQMNLIIIGGGGILLMLALVYFLTERLIVEPVSRISRATSRIATGDLNARLPQLGGDEVGRLASSVGTMVDELLAERRILERLATTDGLTELWNHRYFQERLRQELNRALRVDEPLAVIMLDLDGFKAFNDTHGHMKGDDVLKKVGHIMRNLVRPYDVPCRYGGEEFTVIVPGSTAEPAREIAERIRRRIAEESFSGAGTQRVSLTASFGISSYPSDGHSPGALVMAADTALYAAKRSGGNAVRVYDPSCLVEASQEPSSLEQLFKEANLSALQAMARASDARQSSAVGHSAAVTGYVRRLGAALGLTEEDIDVLGVAALLHDVGKIGVPESILTKTGSLTDREWEIVRAHPVIGELMIRRVPSLSKTLTTVLHHHERWDGTGYPDGLKGETIPLFARLLSITDAYEAMTAVRPYRHALTTAQALEEIKKGAGSQFDPRLVYVFVGMMEKRLKGERDSTSLDGNLSDLLEPVVNVEAHQDEDGSDDRDVKGAHDLA